MNMNMSGRPVIWKTPSVTEDGLKIFACVMMMVQTIGISIVENGMIHLERYTQTELSEAMAADSHLMLLAGGGSVMQLLGGLALPIFAYLLVEGFLNTSSYRKYLLSIVLFAVVSEIPYDLAMAGKLIDWSSQNALVTMAVCLLMLYFLGMVKEKKGFAGGAVRLLIVLCALVWVTLFRAQYGLCMVLLAAVFYLFYNRNVLKTVLGVLISLLYVTGPLAFYGIWCCNEKRTDRLPKYAYYVFYPLHLLFFGVISTYFMG